MRNLIIATLLLFSIMASGQNYIMNPETGKFDYYSNVNPGSDTTINFGTNNTLSSDTLNGVIGHYSTVDANRSLSFGNNNIVEKDNNIVFGTFLKPDTTETIMIGRGWSTSNQMVNAKYGSVGIGYFSSSPVMYVQGGYEAGESYVDDIGGVSIGSSDLDTLTSLQITSHKADGTSYFLKLRDSTGVDRMVVDDQGNVDISGIITVDSLVCIHTPIIHSIAGDTSNYQTPDKVGDMFINTTAGDIFISAGSTRGDWVKLN